MTRISELLGKRVVTEKGSFVGHVFDVHAVRRRGGSTEKADQTWRVRGIVAGRRGLRARVGLSSSAARTKGAKRDLIEWQDIVTHDRKEIVVRDRQ
jgi:sporulation protein YlmC with PRC-barrel domain